MSKGSLASLVVSALTLCGTLFAAVQLSRLNNSVSRLEERVTHLETGSAAGPVAGAYPADVARLRAELDRVMKAQKETVVIPGNGGTGGLTADDLNRAIDEAHKIKEKESRAKSMLAMVGRIEEHNKKFEATLAGQVKVTKEEGEQIKAILAEEIKSYRELMSGGVTTEELTPRIKAINADVDSKIRALLPPDKQKKFDEIPASKKWFGGLAPSKEDPEPR